MDRKEIEEALPHRGSMLLVDEAEVSGKSGRGSYTVKGTEFFLDGHFPGNPVVPGVILCEIAAQVCGVGLAEYLKDKGLIAYFTSLDAVRIRKTVRPGEKFCVEFNMAAEKPPFYFFEVTGTAGGQRVMSGKFSFAVQPK